MGRPSLNVLYQAMPARAFERAISMSPIDAHAHSFLLEHADELDVECLRKLFTAERPSECREHEGPLVRRLAALLPTAGDGQLLEVLRISRNIDAALWIDSLILPLRGRIVSWKWYRFVDKARGGDVFNALQEGISVPPHARNWNPDTFFDRSIEENRREPFVATLLDCAHDDRECVRRALDQLPIRELFALHAKVERDRSCRAALPLDTLQRAAASRVARSDERWFFDNGVPQWMAPFVANRLALRTWSTTDEDHAEAASLYRWLVAQPPECHRADLYEIAFVQFTKHSFEVFWQKQLGRLLSTGGAWKKHGASLLGFCIDFNKGLPVATIEESLNAADETDGAKAEDHRLAILKAVHNEAARLLLARAESALNQRAYGHGNRFLTAFLSLDADSMMSMRLRVLRKMPGLPKESAALLDACTELVRTGRRTASIDGASDAFLILSGQK